MPNRLADETSPYLLQHANNPVRWYPWADEALSIAKQQQKPVFLSVGYSACHWCHVMEHESFENDEIANVLNEHFVSIKVDREERPDIDQIYMTAVQLLTGRGGWPMSVFLTPDLQPFYGGTYWPPKAKMGMPGFDQVLQAVIDAWQNRRQQAVQQAAELTAKIKQVTSANMSSGELGVDLLRSAAGKLEQMCDFTHGGFGGAPKFPHPMNLNVLLRAWRRWPREGLVDMVRLNLDKMAAGGIYDHLGGGFARYSVDERWLVPHFEKMLYDNALLTGAYLDGYLVTGDEDYARVVRETCNYVLRDMTDVLGGFHSTEDADSEGEEGKFYVWTPAEIERILGAEISARFCYIYDVTEGGNFEGKSILNRPKTIDQCAKIKSWDVDELSQQLAAARQKLLAVRDQRIRPGKDDKVLVSWNGLMIDSMARAGAILGVEGFVEAAQGAASFIRKHMRRDDGRLWHSWRQGHARCNAYLDDYACLANALASLYEADFDERWIDWAAELADTMLDRFRDNAGTGFFFTSDDHDPLIARTKDLHDSSVPSGSGMAATSLLRLGKLTGCDSFREAAAETLESSTGLMQHSPTAGGQLLIAMDMQLGPFYEIAVLGDGDPATSEVITNLRNRFLPNAAVACRRPDQPHRSSHLDALFSGKEFSRPGPVLYVCEGFACQHPVQGTQAAIDRLDSICQQAE